MGSISPPIVTHTTLAPSHVLKSSLSRTWIVSALSSFCRVHGFFLAAISIMHLWNLQWWRTRLDLALGPIYRTSRCNLRICFRTINSCIWDLISTWRALRRKFLDTILIRVRGELVVWWLNGSFGPWGEINIQKLNLGAFLFPNRSCSQLSWLINCIVRDELRGFNPIDLMN